MIINLQITTVQKMESSEDVDNMSLEELHQLIRQLEQQLIEVQREYRQANLRCDHERKLNAEVDELFENYKEACQKYLKYDKENPNLKDLKQICQQVRQHEDLVKKALEGRGLKSTNCNFTIEMDIQFSNLQKIEQLNEVNRKQCQTLAQLDKELKIAVDLLLDAEYKQQESLGNTRAYVRIKEPVEKLLTVNKNRTQIKLGNDDLYTVDYVFPSQCSQKQVFSYIQPLIGLAISGKTICVFTCGQAGSGKSYTLNGPGIPPIFSQKRGIIQRVVQSVFKRIKQQEADYWRFRIFLSMKEIYLDKTTDLFAKDIKKKNQNDDVVQDVKMEIMNVGQLYQAILMVIKQRVTAKTNRNAYSSRSQLITTIQLQSQRQDKTRKGKFCITDLVGKDRSTTLKEKVTSTSYSVFKSSEELESIRLQKLKKQETASINLAMMELGRVYNAPKENNKLFFYRSPLIQCIKEYLRKGTISIMLMHVHDAKNDIRITKESLEFCSSVRQGKLE